MSDFRRYGIAVLVLSMVCMALGAANMPTVVSEFIFEKAPFRSCHASTVVELKDGGMLAAWFGGAGESHKGTGIWTSRKSPNGSWSAPVVVAEYPETACWNPVLYRDSKGALRLFFKVGSDERAWVGAYRISRDDGQTWGPIVYLPAGLLGPVRTKPIYLSNGALLAGSSVEAGMLRGDRKEQPYWAYTAWMEMSHDDGDTWTRYGPILYPGTNYSLIQPTEWEATPGHIVALFRSTEDIGKIAKATSNDGGKTWSAASATNLPNPDSGIDAVKMNDGRIALIFNDTSTSRSPINLAFSKDNGKTWGPAHVLEDTPGSEFSYPAMIQGKDGLLHMTYTWNRTHIKYVVVDPRTIRD
ncbi:MAG: exo-alpha-sialidase [Bryobacterales bacterium]|nr:exo-alpha-sialidase [Bryobacterales bacterium]